MSNVETSKIKLEVFKDRAKLFRECQKALGHDSLEQTFDKMLDLLYAAIGLTSKDNPEVNLYTRDRDKIPESQSVCPECGHKFLPSARSDGMGFRETTVNLAG